jgi:hypothetical protein
MVGGVKRIALGLATAFRWLFLVIFVGWIIAAIVLAIQGRWGKVAISVCYIVSFGLVYFVIIPRGVPALLRRGRRQSQI